MEMRMPDDKYSAERYDPSLAHCSQLYLEFDGKVLKLTGGSIDYSYPAVSKHGQDLPYTGGEFSGLVSKRLNKYQKPSIQAFPEEGFMFSNPRGSYHEMSWQVIRESA
jgi:hypothetical protein